MQYKFLLAILFLFFVSTLQDDHGESLHISTGLSMHLKSPVTDFWKLGKQKDIATDTASLKQSSWYAEALQNIEESEYEIKYDEATKSYTSPNRKNGLRSFYTANSFTLLPRNDSVDKWKLELTTLGLYANHKLVYAPAGNRVAALDQKTIRFNNENNFITEYINSKEGVRQNFIIQKEPTGKPQNINIKLQTNKGWFINKVHDKEIHFAKATKTGFDKKITYNGLKAWDAEGRELDASFEVVDNKININVNTGGAIYPVTVDPLSTTANWMVESNVSNSKYGTVLANAGDINGDGFSDVLVGTPYFNAGQTQEGKIFLYLGSSTGLSLTPAWSVEGNQTGARLGQTCGTAGDVNADGFSDVIIGVPFFDNGQNDEGIVYVFYGSVSGLAASADWVMENDNANSVMGSSVSCAGDVNGDGYSDVIIGAQGFTNNFLAEGRAYIFNGSATGLSISPSWMADGNQFLCGFGGANINYGGNGVACAGDVNGDGYSDVLVTAVYYDNGNNNEGKVFLYLGSASGVSLTSSWSIEGNQDNALLGNSIASAGDVNGDGYSDVLVGAPLYDNGQTNEGIAYAFYGSAGGLSVTPNQTFELNMANALFGCGVACAGDVNGDGYADIIIGASDYGNPEAVEGTVKIFFGSASGLPALPGWAVETNQSGFAFGFAVASAGDVNGDGYSDVFVGAPDYYNFESQEGAAFVYNGSPDGLSASPINTPDDADQATAYFGYSVASAGDVNSDGYSDVIIGAYQYDESNNNEGRAFVYHGSVTGLSVTPNSILDDANQDLAYFGNSVASAGDVNGDGYSDVIVGAWQYDEGADVNEGRVYVYHGSPGGLNIIPASILDDADQAGAHFGISIAGAGDVNGDGYSDVIIGAYLFDDDFTNEGAAFVYHGGALGLSATPNTILKDANQLNAQFGYSVAIAGDVNGDGYSDVIIGANSYDDGFTNEGIAFVYHGGVIGLNTIPNSILDDADQLNANFGISVSGAGDVNGDGFSDVIVGANSFDDGFINEGRAFVYHGSATGLSATPNSILDDADQLNANFGFSVASAGDVNGDGYSDVIIGAPTYDDGFADEGIAFVYHGSVTGLSATPNNSPDDANQPTALFGYSVAGAGDVNGDGYSDVVIGSYFFDDGFADEGRAFVYYGNNAGGLRNNLFLYNQDLVTPIQQINVAEPNLFGAGLFAKSPLGRAKGKLVWEVKAQGNKFSGNPITNSTAYLDKQTGYTDLGIAGVELKYNVQKVGSKNNKIRARVEYDKVTAITGQVYGPWRYPAGYTMGAYGQNSVPLPITLLSFNGQFVNADDVQLKWITSNEINMQAFVVERSTDGINFTAIGELAAKGIGGSRSDYSLIDKNVKADLLYYRLKLKDKAADISYTKVITVNRSKIVKGFIAPNPVQQGNHVLLNLQSTTDKNSIHVNIYNSSGQFVFRADETLHAGKNEITLFTNKLSKGVYLVNVLKDGGRENYRLVVQ